MNYNQNIFSNQNIFNNQNILNKVILGLIIFFTVKSFTPNKDSLLYILKKYLNYFLFQFKYLLSKFGLAKIDTFLNTFPSLQYNNDIAPSFKSTDEIGFVHFFISKYPDLTEKDIYRLYHSVKSLETRETFTYFLTPSDPTVYKFNDNEKNKLLNIILNKLNSNKQYQFSNMTIDKDIYYNLNIDGKEVSPFVFNIDSNLGSFRIYINLDIRNDIYQNKEYVVFNQIKPIKDVDVIFTHENTKLKYRPIPGFEDSKFNGDEQLIFTDLNPKTNKELEGNNLYYNVTTKYKSQNKEDNIDYASDEVDYELDDVNYESNEQNTTDISTDIEQFNDLEHFTDPYNNKIINDDSFNQEMPNDDYFNYNKYV